MFKKTIKAGLIVILVLAVCLVAGYIILLGFVQGGITLDVTSKAELMYEERDVSLPWYYMIGADKYGMWDGTDADGDIYTKIGYDLPTWLEDTEMVCIVSWDEPRVMLYIAEGRGMEFMYDEFAPVEWEPLRSPDD